MFSNGGESISGRLNYDREAKCFINQQTGFCNMNDTPKINGFQSDVKIRCVAVRTAYSYLSPKEFDEARAKPFEKVADEDIKDSSSVRDMSLNDPPCQRVSRSRLMSASTKKTRRPKSKACSKMLPTTRVMRSLDLL